MKDIPEPCQTH